MILGWDAEQIRLDDEHQFETLNGLWTGKKPPFVTAGVIRNTNFTESGRVDYSDVAWLQVEEKQLAKRQLMPGDIIVERSGGGPKQPVGRVVFFDREDGPFSFSNFTSVIRVHDHEAFDSKFVFYGLLELYQSGRTEDIQSHTTGIRNLNFKAYKEGAVFPKIPIPEQRKIAVVLGVVQQATEQQDQLLQLTAELKKTLLCQLFTKGLRGEPQKHTEFGPVPESWNVVELRQLSHKPEYGFTESARPSGNARFLRITDIQENGVQWGSVPFCECPEELIERYLLADNDILFARIGATTGKIFLVKKPPRAVFASYLIRVRVKSDVSADFVSQFCNTTAYWRQIDTNKGNNLKGGINSSTLKRLLVPAPPDRREQDEIAGILLKVDLKATYVRRKREALSDLFRTLLYQLMTAQIRVNDLDLSAIESQAL